MRKRSQIPFTAIFLVAPKKIYEGQQSWPLSYSTDEEL